MGEYFFQFLIYENIIIYCYQNDNFMYKNFIFINFIIKYAINKSSVFLYWIINQQNLSHEY